MSTMTKPKSGRGRGRPKSGKKKLQFNISISEDVFGLLEDFRKGGEFEVDRSKVIERSLLDFFAAKGMKPKDADD